MYFFFCHEIQSKSTSYSEGYYTFSLCFVCSGLPFYLAKKDLLRPGSDFAGNNYYFNTSFYGALAVGGTYFFRGEGVTAGEWFKDLAGAIGLLVLVVLSLPLYLMIFYVGVSPLMLLGNLLTGNIDYLFLFYYLLISIFFIFFLLSRKSGK